MYGYYSIAREDTDSLTHKVDGLAKLAAIAGLAIGTKPLWSKLAGSIGVEAAQRLGGKLAGKSVFSAINSLFDTGFKEAWFDFPADIRKAATNTLQREQRTSEFFTSLKQHVAEDSTSLYEEVIPDFRSHAQAFGIIGSLEDTDVDKVILNPNAIRKLIGSMESRGVKFKQGFHREQLSIMEDIVGRTSSIQPTKEAVDAYLYNEANQKELQLAHDAFVEARQKNSRQVRRFASLGPKYQEITGKDLQTDETIVNATNVYLKRVGVEVPDGSDPVGFLIQQAKDLHHEGERALFSNGREELMDEARREESLLTKRFNQKFGDTVTGLVYNTETKEVFSMAALKQNRVQVSRALMNELQIPLVPFIHNVPLKVFSFLKPSSDVIRNLGNVGLEPELRREFLKNGFTRAQIGKLNGLGIDDKLLTFSEDGVKYHNTAFKRILSYERAKNMDIDTLAEVRDQAVERRSVLNEGVLKSSQESHSRMKKFLYATMSEISEVSYDYGRGGYGS